MSDLFFPLHTAPTVQLIFSSHLTKSKAEKCRGHILQAFESVLGSPVTIEIRCESRKDAKAGAHVPLISAAKDFQSQMVAHQGNTSDNRRHQAGCDDISQRVPKDRDFHGVGSTQAQLLNANSLEMGRSEIVEILPSPRELTSNDRVDTNVQSDKTGLESSWAGEASSAQRNSTMASVPERRKFGEQSHSQSLVRSKVSLAHVIQQAEGCSQRSGWSKRKAVSIAERLEQENLYVPPCYFTPYFFCHF